MPRPNMFPGSVRVCEVIVRMDQDRLASLRKLAAHYGTDVPSFIRFTCLNRLDEFEREQASKRAIA